MNKRVLFTIQGEGRGHMTQSLALKEILEKNKYNVVAAIIGTSSRREIPDFIRERLNIPIHEIESPNFVTDKDNKGLDIRRSITDNALVIPKYLKHIKSIKRIIQEYRTDLIINFYEPLMGLYHYLNPKKHKFICVAHQYLTLHPGFRLPEGFTLERKALQFFSRLTSHKADAMLGLSFYEMPDRRDKKIFVVPPLLRPEIHKIKTSNEGFLLIYLLNKGYKSNIIEWHVKNPEIAIHCFTDDPEIDNEQSYDSKLTFHQLNGQKFLEKMSKAMAMVSTAGFESVCEAMYMGKPALMVPVEGHYEQFINSRDAHFAGAGVYSDHFDIDKLIHFVNSEYRASNDFKNWADQSEKRIIRQVNKVMYE